MAKDLSSVGYSGYTAETVATVQKLFDKYDLDNNCRLSSSEFKKVLVECGLSDVDSRAIYGKCDSNNDGSVDMKEFINWLYAEAPDMDTAKADEAADRMAKVHRHMKRGVMSKDESMQDFFEFMEELKEDYKYAKKRDVVTLEKDIRVDKDGKEEATRDVRLKDFFNSMDMNGNGKLTMSEFVGGMAAFGHTGNKEMVADIFRAIDQQKTKNRVWDRHYHQYKKQEDDLAAQGKTAYLAPACEIFEKRDMRKWNSDRAEAINEAMTLENEKMHEARQSKKEEKKTAVETKAQIKELEDTIAAKRIPNTELDNADNKNLMMLNKELLRCENAIDRLTNQLQEPRFTYTKTTLKDGLIDYKEFEKAFTDNEKSS